jgi:Arc/MetJ-type ribon-helix-helix transcriptional regulator
MIGAMAEVKIDLPEHLVEHAQRRVDARGYLDLADYIRDLVRRDEAAEKRLVQELEKGLASGVSARSFDEIWAGGAEKAKSRAA